MATNLLCIGLFFSSFMTSSVRFSTSHFLVFLGRRVVVRLWSSLVRCSAALFAGRNCCSATMSALKAHCGLVVLGWTGHPQLLDHSQHGCTLGVNRDPLVCCRENRTAERFGSNSGSSASSLEIYVIPSATVFPSCLCGLAALVSTRVFWIGMGGDGFQTQKMKSWASGQVEFWLMRLQNTAVEFLLRNECVDTEGFQRKHEQAKNAKNGHPRVGGSVGGEG